MHVLSLLAPGVIAALALVSTVEAFPFIPRSDPGRVGKRQTTWSPSQLIDVSGAHAFQAPTAGQR